MAYITDTVLRTALAKRIGTTLSWLDTSSPHFDQLVTEANEQAYQTILTVLLGAGYEKATIDTWDRREEFNRRLGVCFALREGALLNEGQLAALEHVCKCEEELKTITVTVNGEIVEPDGGNPVVGTGDMANANDVFVFDEMEL